MFTHKEANPAQISDPKLWRGKTEIWGADAAFCPQTGKYIDRNQIFEHLSELNKHEFSQQTFIQVPALCLLLEISG